MDYTPPDSSVPGIFFSQEHWSRLPFLPPGHFPDPGIEPLSPALAGKFFTSEPPGHIRSQIANRIIYNIPTSDVFACAVSLRHLIVHTFWVF